MFNSYHSARDISHGCLKQQWWCWWIYYDEVSICLFVTFYPHFPVHTCRPCETPKLITVCLSVRHDKWALFKNVPPYPPKPNLVTFSPHFPVYHLGRLPTRSSSTGLFGIPRETPKNNTSSRGHLGPPREYLIVQQDNLCCCSLGLFIDCLDFHTKEI